MPLHVQYNFSLCAQLLQNGPHLVNNKHFFLKLYIFKYSTAHIVWATQCVLDNLTAVVLKHAVNLIYTSHCNAHVHCTNHDFICYRL
jgi:hypothetical protein